MSNINALTSTDIVNRVDQFIADHVNPITKAANDNQTQIAELEGRTQEGAWKLAAETHRLALVVLNPNHRTAYEAFLKYRKVANTANQYLSFVKAVFGQWTTDESGRTVWVHDRSREKYANYLRHFFDKKIQPDDVVEYIRTFDEGKNRKKLRGIEFRDRLDNPSAVAAARTSKLRDAGKSQPAFAELDTTALPCIPADVQQGAVWFTVENGKAHIRGFMELSEERLQSLYYNLGKELESRQAA